MKCGIVDVGSNTIRLSIYRWEGQEFKLLMNKKEMAGLASYIKNGVLSDSGILAACRVLAGFKALMANFDIPDLRVFGTASLRNIVNTEEALETIRTVTGLPVEVLSGADEAAFSFLGAVVGGGAPDSGLLADVGGGSTELVAYREGGITWGCSLPMGSLSLYTGYVSGLFPTKEERKALRARIRAELEKTGPAARPFRRLTGVGGTFRAAARLCNLRSGADPDNRVFQAGEIHSLYKDLKKGGREALGQILRAVPDRVHTIVPGLAILDAVLDRCQASAVTVSPCGVREGYLLRRVMEVKGYE